MEVTLLFTALLSAFMIALAVRVLDLKGSPVTKSFHKPDRQIGPNDLEIAILGHAFDFSKVFKHSFYLSTFPLVRNTCKNKTK